jgi:hypothetical protein
VYSVRQLCELILQELHAAPPSGERANFERLQPDELMSLAKLLVGAGLSLAEISGAKQGGFEVVDHDGSWATALRAVIEKLRSLLDEK